VWLKSHALRAEYHDAQARTAGEGVAGERVAGEDVAGERLAGEGVAPVREARQPTRGLGSDVSLSPGPPDRPPDRPSDETAGSRLAAERQARWRRTPALRRLLSTPWPFDPPAVRAACIVLFVAYGGITSLVPLDDVLFWRFWAIRGLVLVYAALGVLLARRLTLVRQRVYSVGLALVLPLTTSYMEALRGNHIGNIAFTALTTFIPLTFLTAARDFLVVDVLLILGNAVLLNVMPPPAVPVLSIWVLILGAIGSGTAAGLVLVIYRGMMNESLTWWKETYARERTLREFAESASRSMAGGDVLDTVTAGFQATIAEGCCLLFLADGGSRSLRLAAAAGLAADQQRRLRRARLPSAVEALWRRLEVSPEPVGHAELAAGELRDLEGALRLPFAAGGLVALPLVGYVRGMIVLVAPEPWVAGEDALLMWGAMANQAAIAIANAHAWERLREQEARARRLAEERAEVAEMRSRFVTQASHEFRTPLAVILAASDVLKRYSARLTLERQVERINKIQGAARQMTELLDDVLTLGRAEAGKLACAPQAVDLEALCREILLDVQATAPGHRLLSTIEDAGSASAVLDPKLVQLILRNLLGNAVKYSPEGGNVELAVTRRDGTVVLRVSDQGIGIAPEDLGHIFEPFQRGTNVGTVAGTGLGLAITRRAVESHGGTIAVENQAGAGATFVVSLPDGSGAGGSDGRIAGESKVVPSSDVRASIAGPRAPD